MGTTTKRAGRPAVDSELVRARLPRDLLDVLDRVRKDNRKPPLTRADIVRTALRDWATATGYLPLPPAREDAN